MTDPISQHILQALFYLSRETRHISASTLAAVAGVTPTRAGSALLALERAGLVDASRARLTMRGLVAAARASAASGGSGIEHRARVQPAAGRAVKSVPWAADSQWPQAPASVPAQAP